MKFRKFIITFIFAALGAEFSGEEIKSLVVVSQGQNLTMAEKAWLPESVNEEMETNLQTYTGFKIISSSEQQIKELQKKSESSGFDENTAIELGKLTSASHGVFLKVLKGGSTYTVTAEVTDLTTGVIKAKSASSAKTNAEAVANTNGSAVDEVTIDLCRQLGINLTNSQKYLLENGTFEISGSEQMAIYSQEVANYNRQISNFDAEIAKLMKSSSLDAVTKKQKLESERALAEEKKKAAEENKARIAEIEKARKEEAVAAAGRNEELQKEILDVSKEVNEKAAELRKLKTENLGALGKIRLLESKKAALNEIRNNVKKEQADVKAQYKKEYDVKIAAVNNAPWRTAEKNEDGKPAPEAIQDRKAKVLTLEKERDDLILEAQKKIAEATYESQCAIMGDIMRDINGLPSNTYYATTLNNNLLVKIGNYSRSNDGWKVNYKVLCDGVEIGSSEGFLKYDGITSFIPSGMDKFDAIDMYDSLFKCGEPVLTFCVSYTVEVLEGVSKYQFNFGALNSFNTKTVQADTNGKLTGESKTEGFAEFTKIREIKPGNEWEGIYYRERDKIFKELSKNMVKIPEMKFEILNTELTQKVYTFVMGENPSYFKGDNNPVESVSWFDVIYFCNKASEKFDLKPVYSVNGTTDVSRWNYTPGTGTWLDGKITQNTSADGIRLPSGEEWECALKCGLPFYSDLYNTDRIWYEGNSEKKTHPAAQKRPNEYGLYDMIGNVSELIWDSYGKDSHYSYGSNYAAEYTKLKVKDNVNSGRGYRGIGFRIVWSYGKVEHAVPEGKNVLDDFKILYNKVRKEVDLEEEKQAAALEQLETEKNAVKVTALSPEEVLGKMSVIPGKNIKMLKTEVTQKLYESIMVVNRSSFRGDNYPIENINIYDAIIFCNKLSNRLHLKPVYSIKGTTDFSKWKIKPDSKKIELEVDSSANGFRLPTEEEWEYAEKGGTDYLYSGSNDPHETAWYSDNSDKTTHPVAMKKPNGYGLYDMRGNVNEFVGVPIEVHCRVLGESYRNTKLSYSGVDRRWYDDGFYSGRDTGFRIVCSASK